MMRPLPSMRQTNFALISTALALPSFAARPQLSTATVSLLMASTFFFLPLWRRLSLSSPHAERVALESPVLPMPLIFFSPFLALALALIATCRTRRPQVSCICPCLLYFCALSLAPALVLIATCRTLCSRVSRLANASHDFCALSRLHRQSLSSANAERVALESFALHMASTFFFLSL